MSDFVAKYSVICLSGNFYVKCSMSLFHISSLPHLTKESLLLAHNPTRCWGIMKLEAAVAPVQYQQTLYKRAYWSVEIIQIVHAGSAQKRSVSFVNIYLA